MSNIHTLSDSNGPNTAALPNPWTSDSTSTSDTAPLNNGVSSGNMSLVDLGYRQVHVPVADLSSNPIQTYCGLACCPCFMDKPFSTGNKTAFFGSLSKVCMIIMMIDIFLFIAEIIVGGIVPLSENPMVGPSVQTLISFQAKDTARMKEYQLWRFITPIFIHGGFIHIFLNMFFQFTYTLKTEYLWGSPKYCIFYLVCGISGVVTSTVLSPSTISVGASGALFGFIGEDISDTMIHWYALNSQIKLQKGLNWLFVIIIISGASSGLNIDNYAHIGGLVAGVLLGLGMHSQDMVSDTWKKYVPPLVISVVGMYVIGGIIYTLFILEL